MFRKWNKLAGRKVVIVLVVIVGAVGWWVLG